MTQSELDTIHEIENTARGPQKIPAAKVKAWLQLVAQGGNQERLQNAVRSHGIPMAATEGQIFARTHAGGQSDRENTCLRSLRRNP